VKVKYSKQFLRDIERVTNPALLQQLDEQISRLKSATRLSDAGQVTKLAANAFRLHVRDHRLGFFLEADTVTLHRFLDRKEIYRFFP
jgi:mRNA interferase RelE/StbE